MIAVFAAVSCGCGTVANLVSDEPTIYGGPAKDIEFWTTPSDTQKLKVNSDKEGECAAISAACCVADIPLSIVGDTLTLPLAVYIIRKDKKAD